MGRREKTKNGKIFPPAGKGGNVLFALQERSAIIRRVCGLV
jgi:hypothetical protein